MARSPEIRDLTQQNVETVAQIERSIEKKRTGGERLANAVATTFGSWTFIVFQAAVVVGWVGLNTLAWLYHWDPYPFVLLNLALSIQVAFASPIIVMSQNRQARLSDVRNHLNLQISLLSEQENTEMLKLLRLLCEKSGIDLAPHSSTHRTLEQPTRPEDVLRQIADLAESGNSNSTDH